MYLIKLLRFYHKIYNKCYEYVPFIAWEHICIFLVLKIVHISRSYNKPLLFLQTMDLRNTKRRKLTQFRVEWLRMCCVGKTCFDCKKTWSLCRHVWLKPNSVADRACYNLCFWTSYHICSSHRFFAMSISFGAILRAVLTVTTGLALQHIWERKSLMRLSVPSYLQNQNQRGI